MIAAATVTVGLVPAVAQETGDPSAASEATPASSSIPEVGPEDQDPCAPATVDGSRWVDWMNRWASRTVCSSAMWFDGFFGDDRAYDEYRESGGRVSLHLIHTDRDGLEPKLRFRAKIPLPNLNQHMDAFIGREAPDQYLTDSSDGSTLAPASSLADQDEDFFLGLGYTPFRGGDQRLRLSGGLRATLPLAPYAKAQYRYVHMFSDSRLIRWRQTLFWEGGDGLGFGTTTNLDLDNRFSEAMMARWTNTATFAEETLGVDWWSTLHVYQQIDSRNGLAYRLWVSGESRAPVQIQDYGVRVVFRRRVLREWLFLDIGAGVSWPRFEIEETRELNPGVGVGLEMQFGDRRWW